MPNDEPKNEPNKLSYEVLLAKIEEQNKTIAGLQEQVEDMKGVIKANMSKTGKSTDNPIDDKSRKEKLEKRLMEDLKLC